MKVTILAAADDDLARIAEWIATDNRSAAARMVSKIRDRIIFLEMDELAHMGRPGFIEGTRELIEYPYIIVYRVDDAKREIVVLSIVHGARDREGE
jgi:plasmid stabilization system protein ParE